MKKIVILLTLSMIQVSFANESDLDKKLDDLRVPDDKVTPLISKDKLYIINKRYSSLVNRHEFSLMGGHNFTADSHLDVKQAGIAYRYHLNSKWSFGLRYTEYNNELTSAGKRLYDAKQILPDTDFALSTQEIFATYNTIYGKLRWSEETVLYFDQYISLGYGEIELQSNKENIIIADLGVAFWIGKHLSSRIGIKNEFYKQNQLTTTRSIHNAMGYLEIGYLFGTGDKI